MNQTKNYVRVGIAAILALILAFVIYYSLSGSLAKYHPIDVVFTDAQGITAGAPVRMAGVRIGTLNEIKLTPGNEALLKLRIDDRYRIPTGSKFSIVSTLLGGAPSLVVTPAAATNPPVADGSQIMGESGGTIDAALNQGKELLGQSKALIASFQKTADALAKVAGDPEAQQNLKAITRNLRDSTQQLPALERQAQRQLTTLSTQVNQLLYTFERAANNGNRIALNGQQLTKDLQGTLAENRKSLRSLLQNANETASSFAGLTGDLRSSLKGTIGSDKVRDNLAATTDNLASVTARLDSITSDFQRLSGDPRLNSDLRETVANLRDTTASIKNLTARIETIRIPGERRAKTTDGATGTEDKPAPPRPVSATSLLEPGLILDSNYDTKHPRLRLDSNFTLLSGSNGNFYRAGLYDLSETNKLNLQVGRSNGIPATRAVRFGIVAGKLGGGFDLRLGLIDLRFDLFNPNHFTTNGRAKLNLGGGASVLTGVDSIGKNSRTIIGVQIRR